MGKSGSNAHQTAETIVRLILLIGLIALAMWLLPAVFKILPVIHALIY